MRWFFISKLTGIARPLRLAVPGRCAPHGASHGSARVSGKNIANVFSSLPPRARSIPVSAANIKTLSKS